MSKKNRKSQNQGQLYVTKNNSQHTLGVNNDNINENAGILFESGAEIGVDFAKEGEESKTIESEVQKNQIREDEQVKTVNYSGTEFYSQCNEDKYLSEYFNEYQIEIPQTIVEIGAGRPEEISNSRYWIKEGFKAQLIEPNHALYTELTNFYNGNDNVQVNQLMIGKTAGVGELAVSKKHWALSMASDELENQEDHEMQVVGIEPLIGALSQWKDWTSHIGILSIDTEGREMMILSQMIEANIHPVVVLVESQNEADTKSQIELLKSQEYDYIATLSLTNVFIKKQYRKDSGK